MLRKRKEKIASIYTFVGKKTSNVETLSYGDIGATVKLSNTNVNDTLSPNGDVKYAKIETKIKLSISNCIYFHVIFDNLSISNL